VWQGLVRKINDAYAVAADGMISSMIRWLLALNKRFGAKKPVSEEEAVEPGKENNPHKKLPKTGGRFLVWNRWLPQVVVKILENRKNVSPRT